ncbi:hypothetical protein AB0J35_57750, partial [Nonomuraea angiospora]|uniref:hypothetical protein n=1 Tax=Nonomuraea angiospora TaxID=46172 RepID=UPI0034144F30
MPIAIDASSPAGATGGGTITTAAFNPPANSLLVAVVAASATTPTISNSVTARTWTLRKVHTNASYKGIAIYTAPNPTALTGTQVTVGSATGGVKIYVVTGAHPTSPIGTNGVGTTATNNATIDAYTSTAAGSRAFCAAVNWNGAAAPTSTDDETAWFAS